MTGKVARILSWEKFSQAPKNVIGGQVCSCALLPCQICFSFTSQTLQQLMAKPVTIKIKNGTVRVSNDR